LRPRGRSGIDSFDFQLLDLRTLREHPTGSASVQARLPEVVTRVARAQMLRFDELPQHRVLLS
jgi:hypothetical protein